MISFLSSILIKNKNDYNNTSVRNAYGVLCSFVGIGLNVLLFLIKFLAGSISGSVAVTADAFNNLSDAGSSIITLVGFRLSMQKPDPEHPYGHGRIEYISGFLVAVIIILMGGELFKSSINKILHPNFVDSSILVLIILVFSILIKLYMFFYNNVIGKKIQSASMKATSMDSLSDCVATLVVLACTLLSKFFGINIDGFCGAAVSILIFLAGYNAVKETVAPLLGKAPDEEFINKIESIVMAKEHRELGVMGMHDLIVHDYGPGRVFVSLHAEVPSNGDIMALHDAIDNIERDLKTELNCHAVIHMDPVLVNDSETNRMKSIVDSVIEALNTENASRLANKKVSPKKVTFHDFRLVLGPTHTNLIFDIVLPFDFSMTDSEAVEFINTHIRMVNPTYFCVIEVDKAYA